jgi:hypothetical protein
VSPPTTSLRFLRKGSIFVRCLQPPNVTQGRECFRSGTWWVVSR